MKNDSKLIGILSRIPIIIFSILLLTSNSFAASDTNPINRSETISVTPVINTAIYASGDLLGTKMTFANAGRPDIGSGVIQTVTILDKAALGADIDVIIFDSDPSATTFTNNNPLTVNDADLTKILCVIPVTTDAAFVDNGVSYSNGTNCVFKGASAATTLYVAMVVRGTPTYVSASDITLRLNIMQD